MDVEEAYRMFQTKSKGLEQEEAARRLEKYGENKPSCSSDIYDFEAYLSPCRDLNALKLTVITTQVGYRTSNGDTRRPKKAC